MKHPKSSPILLLAAAFIVTAMVGFSVFIGNTGNKALAYILTSLVYWCVFCLPLSFYFLGGYGAVRNVYAKPVSQTPAKARRVLNLLAFMPCLGTLFAVFIPNIAALPIQALGLALLYAVLNGAIEELFWRGVFIKIFPEDILKGYLLPTIFFGLWHIALYTLKGMRYQDGFAALVGGATLMGALWGWVAYRTKSIRTVTAAHIVANFFAFSGMIYENWFL